MALATLSHRLTLRRLRRGDSPELTRRPMAIGLALLLVTLVGVPARAEGAASAPSLAGATAAPATSAAPGSRQAGLPVVSSSIGFPVVLGNETLFEIHTGFKTLTPENRAKAIAGRLVDLARAPEVDLGSLRAEPGEITTDILAGDLMLMSVFDADATAAGVPREELAADYLTRMRHGLEVYRESFQPRRVVIGFVLAIAVLALSLLLLSAVNRAGRDLAVRADRRLAAREAAAATDGLAHVRFRWMRDVARVGLAATRLALQLAVLLLCVQAVLWLIPWTEGYGNELLAATVVTVRRLALGAVGELPNLLILVLFFFGTRYLLRSASALFDQLGDGRLEIPGFAPEWARPTDRIVTLLVLAFAVVAAWPYIPASGTPAFKGISIFLGALVSLGSGGAVANAIAGTVLMYLRSFRVGDLVKSGETLGVVIEKGFFITRLRTFKNVVVAIPNGQILGGQMLNYTEAGIREPFLATTCVTIGYDAPWRQVHALLERAAARTEGLSRERAPFVLQTALEDFYVRYELNVVLEDPRQLLAVLDRLHANIQDSFNEYGVQIMSPNYRGDRTVPTLVPPDQWYRPPARPPGEGDGGPQSGGGSHLRQETK